MMHQHRTYVPIGGNCSAAIAIRKNLGLSDAALPFDYIRSNFSCIIENIRNNFANFLPKVFQYKENINETTVVEDPNIALVINPAVAEHHNAESENPTDPTHNIIIPADAYVGDYDHYNTEDVTRYHLINHSFWHHNLKDPAVVAAFERRINRFQNILTTSPPETEVVFVRIIIAENIMDEIAHATTFSDAIESINPALNYKLIYICKTSYTNGTRILFYTRISDKCAVIDSADYEASITFYNKFGFWENNCIYNAVSEELTDCYGNGFDNDGTNNIVNTEAMHIHLH